MPKLLSHIPNSVKGNIIPLGGEIKSYDNSLNRNIDRFIGKVKSKVPKNFWVLPGMSDIDDVLYLKQAFSDQGNTLDKIIATVGLSFPYVSTKALKALPIAKRNFPYKQVQETSEELQKRGAPATYAYAVAEGNWDKPLISIGDNTFYRGVHLPVVPGGKYADDRLTTPLRPSDVDISSQGFRKMEEYAIDPDLPRLQGIDEQNIASGNYYHNGLWTSGTKSIADQYAKVGRFKVNYNQWADKIFKDPNSTKVVYRETPKDIGNLPVGIVQNFKPSKSSLVGIDANDNVRNMISKFYGKPASEISLQEGRDFLNRARIDFTRFNRPFEDGYHFLPGRIAPTNNKFIYDQGGIVPKAQKGTIFNKTNTQMKNTFATGGQMRNATNSQFVPSYVNGVPVYGFGSWLGKNAGNLLQVAGGIGAMFVPGGQPLGVSMMASGVGGIAGQAVNDKNQKADEAGQRAEAEKQFMLNQYNDSQQYFTNGGMIPSMSRGGFMEGLKFYNDGGNLDNVTNFPVGGTHETNPRGGIPLGNNALVEEGEYVYNFPKQGKYVFSNRY